jgi:hypothetical protein
MSREGAIARAAEAFVRAHCELERLARRYGVGAPCVEIQQDLVVGLHCELEAIVLGAEPVDGRRSPPAVRQA